MVKPTVTVIDGRLEPRFGARSQHTAVVGVIKTHQRRYLHPLGLQVRYALQPRQRTPLFFLTSGSFPVVRTCPGRSLVWVERQTSITDR